MKYGPDSDQKNEWRPDDTCSFCGGWRPSLALAAIKAGATVTPTDKGYKIYIEVPNPDAGKLHVCGWANHDKVGEGWEKFTRERAAELGYTPDEDDEPGFILVAPHGPTLTRKVYTNHFSESQAVELVVLNEKKEIKFNVPGYFYSGLAFGEFNEAITKAVTEVRQKKFDAAKAAESTGQPPAPETPGQPPTE